MYCQTALLLLLATSLHPADNLAGSVVAVFLKNDNRAPAIVVSAMENEAERSLKPAGLEFLWNSDGTRDGNAYSNLVVVTLVGDCRATPASSTAIAGTVDPLGATHVVNGQILPFIDLRCDSVRALLSRHQGTSALFPPTLLGRSLGRVLAHELYHVLLQTTSHESYGLASPAFRRNDLICASLSFGPKVERKLQQLAWSPPVFR
jgi:hypothetical protein